MKTLHQAAPPLAVFPYSFPRSCCRRFDDAANTRQEGMQPAPGDICRWRPALFSHARVVHKQTGKRSLEPASGNSDPKATLVMNKRRSWQALDAIALQRMPGFQLTGRRQSRLVDGTKKSLPIAYPTSSALPPSASGVARGPEADSHVCTIA